MSLPTHDTTRATSPSNRIARGATACGLLACTLATQGCIDRKMRITSNPPGALVTLNDVELGRTPVEADFLYYGEYDIRLSLEGHEPLTTSRKASAPVWEWPGIDIAATVLPVRFDNVVDWHFDLVPALEVSQTPERFEAGLIDRATQLRADLEGTDSTHVLTRPDED